MRTFKIFQDIYVIFYIRILSISISAKVKGHEKSGNKVTVKSSAPDVPYFFIIKGVCV